MWVVEITLELTKRWRVLIFTFIQKHTLCKPPIFVTDGHLQQSLYVRHIARANLGNQHGGFRRTGSWFLIEMFETDTKYSHQLPLSNMKE